MSERKPDFFVLGAPKCATTSLYEWLKSHPQIFVAKKEMHFFNTDHTDREVTRLQDYRALFAGASERHIAVGEVAVMYLYSEAAVANILRDNAEAVFIVMLRNPIDMAYSWHSQVCFTGRERVKDFAKAWNLQAERKASRCAAGETGRADVNKLFYGEVCCLGAQLQRLYQQVARERVHVIVYDDLNANPRAVYRAVLNFLGVPDDHKQTFEAHNRAKVHYAEWLYRLLPRMARLKTRLRIRRNFGIQTWIANNNRREKPRPPLSPQMKRALARHFAEDIRLLERLLGRDLTHWSA